jgi:alginate O-acetyltransferase complex protein AlgJ
MKLKGYILFFGFILVIIFPMINNCLGLVKEEASTENRSLKSFPKLNTSNIESYLGSVEKYVIDHTTVRNQIIRWYNQLNVFVFRSSPANVDAFVGKDDWYYFSGEELKTYNGTELFTEQELVAFKNEMQNRKTVIETKYNARIFLAIVPNKANIYPEFMPDYLVKSTHAGYGKQLLTYLTQQGFPVINLYQPLIAAKQRADVYYKTDNHWNDFGGFVAANAILKEFKKVNTHVNTLNVDSFPLQKVTEKAGSVAKMLSIENTLSDFNFIPTHKNGLKSREQNLNKYKPIEGFPYPEDYEHTRYTTNDSLPTVLIIRDSFGAKLFPYLSEQTKQCTAIFDGWHYGLNEEIIKEEKPDIILYLILESQLKNVTKYQKK